VNSTTGPADGRTPPPETAAPAPAVLETHCLGIRFGGLRAVEDLSFTVRAGRTLGVIGPNGAGKSTLINLITGHLRPSSGTVLIDGKDVTGVRPWKVAAAGVARTFQIVKPFRDLTVRHNVAIGVLYGPHGVSRMSSALIAADEVLARVGLAALANRTPGELSVADARRLELAKALAMRPRLLLLDEVMAGMPNTEIDSCLLLLDDLKREGLTIVVVEHVMRAILAVSDQLLVLNRGRLLTQGAPRDVLADHRVVEAYLGHRYAMRRGR
jgi:branched-chain amino acid transport system ATP-binding protein